MKLKRLAFNKYIVIVAAGLMGILLADYLGLFIGMNSYFHDFSLRMRGRAAQDPRIVIVAIDGKTLNRLGQWPLNRVYYAQLIDRLNQADVIGMDILMQEPTPEDDTLAQSIHRHGRVVMPVYFEGSNILKGPLPVFKPLRTGHVYVEPDIDYVTRSVYHTLYSRQRMVPSFASVIYEIYTGTPLSRELPSGPNAILPMKSDNGPRGVVQKDQWEISYYGPPGTFKTVSMVDVLDGNYPSADFAHKIILVGTTAVGMDSGIITPLTQSRSVMTGIEAQANIVGNLLGGIRIRTVPPVVVWVISIALSFFGLIIFFRSTDKTALLVFILAALGLPALASLLLIGANLWFPPVLLLISWSFLSVVSYILKLEKARDALLEVKQQWEESFDSIEEAVVIMDAEFRIVTMNRSAHATMNPAMREFLSSRSKVIRETCVLDKESITKDVPAKEHGLDDEFIISESGSSFEVRSFVRLDRRGRYRGVIHFVRDITERKRAEEKRHMLETRLQQSSKMEAIGTLAGGIAHDFNNILTSILGFAELAQMKIEQNETVAGELDQVMKAGLRARDLVKQILTFSRQGATVKEPVEITALIKEAIKFIRAFKPVNVEVRQNIFAQNIIVLADPTHIYQVIMNLCTNALYAMKNTGGTLDITLEELDLDEASREQYPELELGKYLHLNVADTGSGIPPEIMGRIFDPFFTSKPRGEGTGMGLSVVHGIVNDMGGSISVSSRQGHGTEFHVLIPLYHGQDSPQDAVPATARKGSGRVLLVDDDESAIASIQGILEQLGYAVTAGMNPQETVEAFRLKPQEYDIVLTDMNMPVMTGLELSEQIKKIRMDIPVVLMSGFSVELSQDRVRNSGISKMVMKPMIASELADALASALESKD